MNVIVTGATKGIGRAIVERFYSEGANLIVCSRNEDDLIQMRESLYAAHKKGEIYYQAIDMSKKDDVLKFGSFARENVDDINVLVNNAGVFYPGEILTENDQALDQMIQTNLYSAYHLTRAIAPVMKKRGRGHIFNMCSVASQIAYPNGGSYSISKFALLGFSKVLREELKTSGVKVTSILPGATWSDSWSGVDLPPERLMQASDIADSIWSAYQLSPSAVVEEIVIRPQLGDL